MSDFDMPHLPGDMRELVLFAVQDALKKLEWIEEQLCLSEDEENSNE
jgi:hypothetical protein